MHPVLALFERNAWANREVLRVCAALDPALLDREHPGTYGPIAITLSHVVRGEQSYLRRLTGDDPSDWVSRDGPTPIDRLATLAEESNRRVSSLLEAGPDPERLLRDTSEGRRIGIPAWLVLLQHVQHGDDHRAQIGTALGASGIEPPNLSARAFIGAGAAGPEGAASGPWADALLPRFLDHSAWATDALLEHCLGLGDEALAATAAGTYGSVQETFTHLLDADADYLSRLTGGEDELLEGAAEPDVLRRYAARGRESWRGYLAAAPDHERMVASGERQAPAWALVVQAVHHANEHRAHVCSILGARGIAHPEVDGWNYGEAAEAYVDEGPIES